MIRRVTFDLIGLPPTPDEIASFVNDPSPDAFQRVVDRLLASPHYGVRWGRRWLDVARYADSNGLDENLAYGQAWRYRDYVVEAFNRDKPFDRFVIEQIAGDLAPGANRESKTATAFLVLGAKVLAEPDMEKLVMDTIDEQIDTTGKAFLALTLGCVRCHDHKFDPLKQKDYYALAAIFKGTRTFASTKTGVIKHWNEHSFASDEERSRLKEVDAAIAKRKQAASSFKSKAISRIRDEARSKAADYLFAATQFEAEATLREVETVAEPLGLHPRILHHCRLHLDYHRDESFFKQWHDLRDDPDALRAYYVGRFEQAAEALAKAKKENPKAKTLKDPSLEEARAALHDLYGFLAVPPKPEFAFDAATLDEYYRLEDEARKFESVADDETAAMGVGENETVREIPIHIRGSHLNLGEPVAREFPEVMRLSASRPIWPSAQSGRLELARWIASSQNPLTARVFVNRLWSWHFGAGLVKSTENFGKLGDRPSHPELLDWLARRFISDGWSVKKMHRLILTSSAYQMASRSDDAESGIAQDPENRLLWRFPIRRLEAEEVRDAILAISGRLDLAIGGKTVPLRNRQFVFNHTSVDHTKYDSVRRAIYLPVIRNNLYTLFEQFDFPDPTMPTSRRGETIVAPQALLMLNADLVMDSAHAMADRVKSVSADEEKRVEIAYQLAFGRPPTPEEVERAKEFLQLVRHLKGDFAYPPGKHPKREPTPWMMFCQSLIAANEFIYLR